MTAIWDRGAAQQVHHPRKQPHMISIEQNGRAMAWIGDFTSRRTYDSVRGMELKRTNIRHFFNFTIENPERVLVSFSAFRSGCEPLIDSEVDLYSGYSCKMTWFITEIYADGMSDESARIEIGESLRAHQYSHGAAFRDGNIVKAWVHVEFSPSKDDLRSVDI